LASRRSRSRRCLLLGAAASALSPAAEVLPAGPRLALPLLLGLRGARKPIEASVDDLLKRGRVQPLHGNALE
jgi:hypothetical protein